MEARFEGQAHRFYGLSSMESQPIGRKSVEWDLNDWHWDGDLFVARQLNPGSAETISRQFFPPGSGIPTAGNSLNSSPSCSDERNLEIIERGRPELLDKKKKRVIVLEDETLRDDAGSLTLNLSGSGCPTSEREVGNWKGNGGKKTKLSGGASNAGVCQVENCGADLSKGKDYHRKHKVCEMHSKASSALVGGIMQRFCQQCSRFHFLHEFDEGKRSCRRRLAGHNKRRRKTNPDTGGNGNPLNDDKTSNYLLISLLKILTSIHSNRSDSTSDQDLVTHLLKSIASQTSENGGRNISGLLQGSQDPLTIGTSASLSNNQAPQEASKQLAVSLSETPRPKAYADSARGVEVRASSATQVKMNDFDLNDIYIDSDGSTEDIERSPPLMNPATSSLDFPSWIQQGSHRSSPPQTSGNSDSASDQSPSSSCGDAQNRTDRIVFKLFGKEPNDFPVVLRTQILDWLAHSPTDMESYIRPGCVILTIYLRQAEAAWEELCSNLGFSLSRLLNFSHDTFWTTGWVYVRVQNQIAFGYNGQVVANESLSHRNNGCGQILSLKPVAIAGNGRAQFTVRGINLSQPGTRLLCAVEGKYLIHESSCEIIDDGEDFEEHDEIQCVNFSCDIPVANSRGFVEIEGNGLSGSFFPFIVAEEDVCSEIRTLESILELTRTDATKQAMDFIHEIGWLLHRSSQFKSRNTDLFPLTRFRWLIEFSMNREWCAVTKKLLNILFDGTVNLGEHLSVELALSELRLLHKAVRKNCRAMVEMLLRYAPEPKPLNHQNFLFRPDVTGPAGLTPLHIAAGKDGSEGVLDALTEDPGKVGVEAWKNARDSTDFTPEDYARIRGHYSYIHLVRRKIKPPLAEEHVVVDIPSSLPATETDDNQKQNNQSMASAFEISGTGGTSSSLPLHCKLCDHKLAHGYYGTATARRSLAFRPTLLSMVAIAAVCVCVALLFKSCPEVLYVFRPFSWESLHYGTS